MSITAEYNTAGTTVLSSSPVIVLENLVKFFGRFAAIRGISATFLPGRLYVILGDNGAGKSTLLRIVRRADGNPARAALPCSAPARCATSHSASATWDMLPCFTTS